MTSRSGSTRLRAPWHASWPRKRLTLAVRQAQPPASCWEPLPSSGEPETAYLMSLQNDKPDTELAPLADSKLPNPRGDHDA